ncbi:MAG: Hpt domain-containing protein, partial [Bacteroides sp.]
SFIEESGKYETELKDALEKKDRVGIGAICHKIYPMVKMIGSTSLSSKLSFLDQKKPTYTEQECITHVKAILIELEQLKTEVEKYLSSVK